MNIDLTKRKKNINPVTKRVVWKPFSLNAVYKNIIKERIKMTTKLLQALKKQSINHPATTMYYYYWKEDNEIVIQNMVGGLEGQLHRHSSEDFERWKEGINPDHLINLDEEK